MAHATQNQSTTLPLPIAEPALDREQLLLAVLKAASTAALGQDDSEQQRSLGGSRFEVRLRFGCRANEPLRPGFGSFNLKFDEEDRTLRISAAPDLTHEDPKVAEFTPPKVEAVEGFWLLHPWLLTEGCPPDSRPATYTKAAKAEQRAKPAADPAAPLVAGSPQQIGIAQFFTEVDSRTSRREHRPYQVIKVLAAGERPSSQGYNLVLTGRLRPIQGKVINCRSSGPDTPPDCVVSAQFDRVFIERPDNKEVLGEWTS